MGKFLYHFLALEKFYKIKENTIWKYLIFFELSTKNYKKCFLKELLSGVPFGMNHFENLTHKIHLVGLHTSKIWKILVPWLMSNKRFVSVRPERVGSVNGATVNRTFSLRSYELLFSFFEGCIPQILHFR